MSWNRRARQSLAAILPHASPPLAEWINQTLLALGDEVEFDRAFGAIIISVEVVARRTLGVASLRESAAVRLMFSALEETIETLHEMVVDELIAGRADHPMRARILRFDATISHTNARLYALSECVGSMGIWGPGFPTPVVRRPDAARAMPTPISAGAISDMIFRNELIPRLHKFNLRRNRLVVAGRALMARVLARGSTQALACDPSGVVECADQTEYPLDIYPVGIDGVGEFEASATSLAAHLNPIAVAAVRDAYVELRFESAPPVRIHTAAAKNLSELLASFDLGSDAIAYDSQIYVSQLGRDALVRRAVVVNPAARYPGYEARLQEVPNDFVVCLPEFDVSAALGGGELGAMTSETGAPPTIARLYDRGPLVVEVGRLVCGAASSPAPPMVRAYTRGMPITLADWDEDFEAKYRACFDPLCVERLRELLGTERTKAILAAIVDRGEAPPASAVYADSRPPTRAARKMPSIVRDREPATDWYGTAAICAGRGWADRRHVTSQPDYFGGMVSARAAAIIGMYTAPQK